MTAAKSNKRKRSETRLLAATSNGRQTELRHLRFDELPSLLRPGDLLVVNDAATLPASLTGVHATSGQHIEMRLGASRMENGDDLSRWSAIFFGAGNWRTPTEHRRAPPALRTNDVIEFGGNLRALVREVMASSGRLAEIEFLGDRENLWRLIYEAGRPVQYSHLLEDLALWDAQTVFAASPVSLEAPSAAFPFNWELVFELERRGVRVARLTHAAGLSSTGDAELDRLLPFPERYWIPDATAEAVNAALGEGRRVIAVGTTVTRALESAAMPDGNVSAGTGVATLRITPGYQRKVVSGILSGFHESGASHIQLLGSFLEPTTLEAAYHEAENLGYLTHEFGDACLILTTLIICPPKTGAREGH